MRRPIALTIAGSDSGGGAGIQADLKVFAALHVHGTTAITCITAQNPKRVSAIEQVSPKLLEAQLKAIFSELRPHAAKTGMVHSAELIEVVAKRFRKRNSPPLVVDPVMIATSGARLLKEKALNTLKTRLLPLATLATPNIPEAEVLLGWRIREPEQMRTAAREIVKQFGCAALIKGGHLPSTNEAIDIFYDGKTELLLSAPRIRGIRTHGTGCTYSAAITAELAKGASLADAVCAGKGYIAAALSAGQYATNHFVPGTGFKRAD
jgi:hydroxymethylpyrimidine/phosphomethylpyrimidine kinase